jgi:hypothetical protein
MPSLRMNLPNMFRNIIRSIPSSDRDQYACCLEELEKHLRETIRGEHTLQEFAEFYCLTDEPTTRVTSGLRMDREEM